MSSDLSHLNKFGKARMVDIGNKMDSERIAIAKGEIQMHKNTLSLIIDNKLKKGDVLAVAEIAGVMAAKRTSELIPLCHALNVSSIIVELDVNEALPGISIVATVRSTGKTGVEMEALTAVSIAALTIYDMTKSADKNMIIQNIRLVEKRGGKSGDIINQ